MIRPIAIAAAALFTTGCITGTWVRETRFEPPAPEAVDGLRPGESGLGHCLSALGAPLWVMEHRGTGILLAYGWFESERFSLNLSVPLGESFSASFDYSEREVDMEGLVLFLDDRLVLTEVRTGLLRDLTQGSKRLRPPIPEDTVIPAEEGQP